MKYTILINKITTQIRKERNWLPTGREVPDEEENRYSQPNGPKKMKKEYDYKNEEKEVEVDETIFKQTIEGDIDLVAIIDAINKK